MLEVIPGILEKDWSEIERKINLVKSFTPDLSSVATVHIDIIDGKFAPNTTFLDPAPFAKYSTDLFLELHMMVENPIQYLESFAKAGFKRFLAHVEKMPDQAEFVAQAQLLGEVGLAIDGTTPLENVKVPFSDLDCILIMTINAGRSGQTFNPEYLKKVETLRSTFVKTSADKQAQIEIDGGINDQTIRLAKNAGATKFVANSFLFSSQDPKTQFNLLKTLAEQ